MAHCTGTKSITDVPKELHLMIFELLSLDLEDEMKRSTEVSCLNSYTRAAKTLRLVCRLWKKLVDLPSSFYLRATVTTLELNIRDIHGEFKVITTPSPQFHGFIQDARSLIFVTFKLFAPSISTSNYAPDKFQMLENFLVEMRQVPSYQSRLYSLCMVSSNKEVLDAFLVMSKRLTSALYMTSLSLSSYVRHPGLTIDGPNQLSSLARKTETIVGDFLTPPIFSLFYQLKILNLYGNLNDALQMIKLPPNLSSLCIEEGISLHQLFTILELCCERLEKLELAISPITTFEEEKEYHSRSITRLLSLIDLEAQADVSTLDCLMTMMDLPNLKKACLISNIDSKLVRTSPDTHGRRTTKTCSLPKLEELALLFRHDDPPLLFRHEGSPLYLINALSDIPKLKRLMISGVMDATREEISIDTRSKLLDLRFEGLTIQETYIECIPRFLSILNYQEVQILSIYFVPESFWDVEPDLPDFEVHLPNLTGLHLSSENSSYLAQCLTSIYFGDKLTSLTLDLDSENVEYIEPTDTERLNAYEMINSKWDEITSGVSSRFNDVNAVATTWPVQVQDHIEAISRICRNTRTLVTKLQIACSKSEFTHPLLDLHPSLTDSIDIIMPSLETVYYLCNGLIAPICREMADVIKNDLLDINRIRETSGANIISTLAFLCYTPPCEPEIVEFYRDNGVTIRFEFINKPPPFSLNLFEDIHI